MTTQLNNEIVELRVAVLTCLADRCGLYTSRKEIRNWVKTSDDAGTWQKIEQKNQGLLGHFRRFVSRLRRFVISREASA